MKRESCRLRLKWLLRPFAQNRDRNSRGRKRLLHIAVPNMVMTVAYYSKSRPVVCAPGKAMIKPEQSGIAQVGMGSKKLGIRRKQDVALPYWADGVGGWKVCGRGRSSR